MCLVFQGFILDGSGAGAGKFRADKRPKTCPTHGIEPPYPPFSRECFAERPVEGQRGVKRGHRKPQVSYVPSCLRRQTAALPTPYHGE